MEEQILNPPKQRGNPNFGKKPEKKTYDPYEGNYDPKKTYQFILINTNTNAKPRDWETGELVDNPYPPTYIWTNEGQAINPQSGVVENWRYVSGYNSIWVKDQVNPVPGKRQLENPKNFIEFNKGSIFVPGINSALMDCLMIQDEFEGVRNPVNIRTPIYKLVDVIKDRKVAMEDADMAFEAEKAAREATFEEIIPVALALGINVDEPEQDFERIRHEFIMRAKSTPAIFSKQFVNPKVKYKYKIIQALRANIISDSLIPGKMVLTDTKKVYFDVKEGDVAEQFATMILMRNDDAVKLYQQIENLV